MMVVSDDHQVGDILDAISAHWRLDQRRRYAFIPRTQQAPGSDETINDLRLIVGETVVVSDQPIAIPEHASSAEDAAMVCDVTAGADAGRSVQLVDGRYRLGRSQRCDIVLNDPRVSRKHLDIEVHGDHVVVIPIHGDNNETRRNGDLITEPTDVSPTDEIAVGESRLTFRSGGGLPFGTTDQLGQINFLRTPYRPPAVAQREVPVVGPIPTRPEPRRFQFLSVLAPLIGGVVMYMVMKNPMFLIFTLLSPIMLISNTFEDRRSGRKKFGDMFAAYEQMLIDRREDFLRCREDERVERLRAFPDSVELLRRVSGRTVDLWGRHRDAPDFGHLRVGLGSGIVQFPIELAQGGDEDLRERAEKSVDDIRRIDHVPITVDMTADPIIGIHGADHTTRGVVASLVLQAAALHSPEDLIMAAAVRPETALGWMKWLPHTRSVTSPIGGSHLAIGADEARGLLAAITELAELRCASESGSMLGNKEPVVWPRILLTIDQQLELDASAVSHLLEVGKAAGISVLCTAPSAHEVPRQATRVLNLDDVDPDSSQLTGVLWSTDPDEPHTMVQVESLDIPRAADAARKMAPIRDASSGSRSTSIPRVAPLLDVLGPGAGTADWVYSSWRASDINRLDFPLGMGADGPLTVDLVADGPHTLIGGTSGAGKSELLQSMVISLAAKHSPRDLNFLFIDYKGGASSKVFEPLPHTVGYVTNLSAELSMRALTSLRAELNRRMAVMEGRAKDLVEMRKVARDDAPASLVMIIDEFATLVKEIPDFVDGIIDIAQRGRSLGIHLVLATQRPTGSVNENILANTNLRISLRMLDRAESSAIIDSPEAASIPVPLRGRALVRLGPQTLVEFQSSFAGASIGADEVRQPVLVAPFDRPGQQVMSDHSGGDDDATTHLEATIDAIVAATARLDLAPPTRPWRDELPEQISLADVTELPAPLDTLLPGRHLMYGLLDIPEKQTQCPAVVDVETSGGWLIFGSGGSGKTTVLRTILASAGLAGNRSGGAGSPVSAVVFDFGSYGLASAKSLPFVVDVANGDRLEAVTRHVVKLEAELRRRRSLLAELGAEDLTAYQRIVGPDCDLGRILLVIDDFGGLREAFGDGGGYSTVASEMWIERIGRLAIDGRQVGIHSIITADRRNAIPNRLFAAVSERLVLNHADSTSYSDYGISSQRSTDLVLSPGRALADGIKTVQVAIVGDDPTAAGQTASLNEVAEQIEVTPAEELRSEALPSQLLNAPVRAPETPSMLDIGMIDVASSPAIIDVTWSDIAVYGTPRSGRSTALAAAAQAAFVNGVPVSVIGPASSPLRNVVPDSWDCGFGDEDAMRPVLERVAERSELGLLIVDDVDLMDDSAMGPLLEQVAKNTSLRLAASAEQRSMNGYTMNPLLTRMRRTRSLLMLRPDDPNEFFAATGIRLTLRPGIALPAGRGVLMIDREPYVVQVRDAVGIAQQGTATRQAVAV